MPSALLLDNPLRLEIIRLLTSGFTLSDLDVELLGPHLDGLSLAVIGTPGLDHGLEAIMTAVVGYCARRGLIPKLIKGMQAARPLRRDIKTLSPLFVLEPGAPPDEVILEGLVEADCQFMPLKEFVNGLDTITQAVCKVKTPAKDGTGFLVAENLVMTNYHVVQNVHEKANRSVDDVTCQFDFFADAQRFDAAQYRLAAADPADWLAAFSKVGAADPGPEELDFALVRVQPVVGGPLSIRKRLKPAGSEMVVGECLIIVQHPGGNAQRVSINSKSVIELNQNRSRVKYRTSTLGGSSGSPCFNARLELVALHNSTDPKPVNNWSKYNQGIPFQAILGKYPDVAKLLS
ncbi:MAG TPA: serine protease [Pirellulaceae bacterium]|nr:serine protease [Pirellulaceae bacterium]